MPARPPPVQQKPRIGEQYRQREMRQARWRPLRRLHARPKPNHLAFFANFEFPEAIHKLSARFENK
jgi:hypothetical protein